MKILKIEAENLNSLYAENSVDLEESLGGASLFLIYGPTGSGKSTLMDAISLALFGVTPRLNAERGNLSADPSAIMSRGTGECRAGVVFSKLEAGGRRTYRARWTCRRARKRPDGTPQAPERSLERLKPGGDWRAEGDEHWTLLGSSKKAKEFRPVFDEVLEGFGVSDFNRSMLLAQGQFDAFLGAPAEERAGILERLTDTSIYKELGERAARMRGRYRSQVSALQILAGAGGGLEPEALAQLERQHALNVAELKRRKEEHERARGAAKWFEDALGQRANLRQSEAAHQELAAKLEAAQADLAQLSEHERCAQAKGFGRLDEHARATEQLETLAETLAQLEAAMPGLEETLAEREAAAQAAGARVKSASEQLSALRPLASQAEAAAAERGRAAEAAQGAAARRDETEGRVAKAKRQLEESTEALRIAGEAREAARLELEGRRADAELAEGWPPLRRRLERLLAAREGLAGDAQALAERRRRLEEERTSLVSETRAHEASREAELETPKRNQGLAQAALSGLLGTLEFKTARAAAEAELKRAEVWRDRVQEAQTPVTRAREGAAHLAEVEAGRKSLSEELEKGRALLSAAQGEVSRQTERESLARQALERTREVAGLVEQRRALQDHEECPLCGSKEHPWSEDAARQADDARIAEVVEAARAAHAKEAGELERAQAALRELEVSAKAQEALLEQRLQQVEEAQETQLDLDRAAAAALEALELPPESSKDEVEAALARAREALDGARQAAAQLSQAKDLASEADQELQAVLTRQGQAEKALRERAATLKERGAQLAADEAQHAQASQGAAEEASGCRARLEAFGVATDAGGPAEWFDEGERRCAGHTQRVEAKRARAAEATLAEAKQKSDAARLEELTRERDTLRGEAQASETQREEAEGVAEEARAKLRVAWAALLASDEARPQAGLPPAEAAPAEFVAAQEARLEELRKAKEEASASCATSQAALADARTQGRTWKATQSEHETLQLAARQRLDLTLAELGLPGDEALRALRLGDEELATLGARRQRLDQEQVALEATLKERRALVAKHETKRPAGLSLEGSEEEQRQQLEGALGAAADALGAAEEGHAVTDGELRAHAQAARAHQENREKLEQAELASRVWERLHQCIGVNDGDKFKEFAQALNLGQLLDRANVHLARLSKRYRLVPRLEDGLPTLDFDLNDLWQVGERVAPRSLSGGERFQVSLALALGLSDFRAVKMPIETLLLDEGFGTLDPDALSEALAALSQLQADGRQVGIISHVVGLRERVEARVEVKPSGGGRSRVLPQS